MEYLHESRLPEIARAIGKLLEGGVTRGSPAQARGVLLDWLAEHKLYVGPILALVEAGSFTSLAQADAAAARPHAETAHIAAMRLHEEQGYDFAICRAVVAGALQALGKAANAQDFLKNSAPAAVSRAVKPPMTLTPQAAKSAPKQGTASVSPAPPLKIASTVSAAQMQPAATACQTDLQSLILDLCSRHAGKDFGFGDNIDAQKMQSARKAFPMPLDVKVYGLVDATVLGTNEKGLAITANGIYWKNGWTQETVKAHLTWPEFNEIKVSKTWDKFELGPGNFFETTGTSYPNGQLNKLLRALQTSLRLIPITDGRTTLSSSETRPLEGATIEQIIEWACNNYSGGGIPVGTLISPKKLANATKEFPLPPTATVVGLVDCTVFGSNKNGLAICAGGIYWKNDWTTKSLKSTLSWPELSSREIGSASQDVLFGQDAILNMAGSHVKPATLAAALKAICDVLRATQP